MTPARLKPGLGSARLRGRVLPHLAAAGGAPADSNAAIQIDRYDDGQLTQFRECLSAEVRAQTGEEFPIFQDRSDIVWGRPGSSGSIRR